MLIENLQFIEALQMKRSELFLTRRLAVFFERYRVDKQRIILGIKHMRRKLRMAAHHANQASLKK